MDGQPAPARTRWTSSAREAGPDLTARIADVIELTGRLSLIGCMRRYGLADGFRRFADLYGIEVPGGNASIKGLRQGVAQRLHLAEERLRDVTANAMRETDDRRFREAFARYGVDTPTERSLVLYAEACLSTVEGDPVDAAAAHTRQEEGLFTVGEAVAVLEVLSLFNRYLADLRPVEVKSELERARAAERERLCLAGDVARLSREATERQREIEELTATLAGPGAPPG